MTHSAIDLLIWPKIVRVVHYEALLVNDGDYNYWLLIQLHVHFARSGWRFYRSVDSVFVASLSLVAHFESVALVLCNVVLMTFKTTDYRLAPKDGRSSDLPRGRSNCRVLV